MVTQDQILLFIIVIDFCQSLFSVLYIYGYKQIFFIGISALYQYFMFSLSLLSIANALNYAETQITLMYTLNIDFL